MNIKDKLKKYLDEYLVQRETALKRSFKTNQVGSSYEMAFQEECATSINQYIDDNKEDETFQTKLFEYIDKKGLKDSEVYNKVYIDRRLFSKIRSNKDYHPSKETIILLGIALELTENEIEDLLKSASYSLPMNTTFDLIIRFCFKERIYDIDQINNFLYDYNCKLLCS